MFIVILFSFLPLFSEPLRTLKVSDEDRSTEISDDGSRPGHEKNTGRESTPSVSSNDNRRDDGSDGSGDDNGGTIAAVIISILVVLAAVGLGALWLMNKRRKQNFRSCE